MISAIAFVLFVLDKYTISILLVSAIVFSDIAVLVDPEQVQADIKTKRDNMIRTIETYYCFILTGLSNCENVSEPIFHFPSSLIYTSVTIKA